jgi:hypothetical protein
LEKTEIAFQQLSSNIDHGWIAEWSRQEAQAMLERGKAMEIYDVALNKGAIFIGRIPANSERRNADSE